MSNRGQWYQSYAFSYCSCFILSINLVRAMKWSLVQMFLFFFVLINIFSNDYSSSYRPRKIYTQLHLVSYPRCQFQYVRMYSSIEIHFCTRFSRSCYSNGNISYNRFSHWLSRWNTLQREILFNHLISYMWHMIRIISSLKVNTYFI